MTTTTQDTRDDIASVTDEHYIPELLDRLDAAMARQVALQPPPTPPAQPRRHRWGCALAGAFIGGTILGVAFTVGGLFALAAAYGVGVMSL